MKIGIMLVTCTLLVCIDARAQNECDGLTENVRLLYRDLNTGSDDELVSLANTARRARQCYGEQSHARHIWLLQKEIYALDLLRRYDEARAMIDLFFDDSDLVGAAVPKDYGRMYMWRLLFFLYDGDYESAAVAYLEARRYADTLPLAQRAALRNNGAMLRIRSGNFERAAWLASEGIALLDSTFQTRGEAFELAKLLQNRGHARLERYDDDNAHALLELARRDLHAAIALRDSLSITERQAEALVTLGEIYHGLGDGPTGRGYMGTGLRLAREGGNPRGEIFALWRMGRMGRRGGLSSLARQQLQQALDLSQENGVGAFELVIQLELGRIFEDRGAWRQAENLYRAIVEAPDDARYRSRLFDDAKAREEAERRRVAMRMHLAEAEASWLRLVLLGLVLLLLLVTGTALGQRRWNARLQRRFTVLKNGAPKEDDLFDRRRRYAYRVLERPAEVAIVLGEMDLSVLLVAGLADRAQLYACVCA